MLKFIHAADIHLDSPLRGLARYEGAPLERIRGATREALKGLVRTAIDEHAAFVIIAGDVFDGDWKDYNTGLFFARQMSRLREAEISVFLLAGNHDAAGKISKTLRMPDNVHRFSTRRPETIILDDIGIALHGQGFARRDITENLAAGYPEPVKGLYNIGVLHTGITGREGHEKYAPCSIADLTLKNYDYWALGHVHRREVVSESPPVVFPGNIQGRHIRETGPKGCTIVSLDPGGSTHIEHRSLDVIRWAHLRIDCTDAFAGDDIVESVQSSLGAELARAEGRMLAARIEITGSCPAHEDLSLNPERWVNEIRAAVTDFGGGEAWVEKILFRTTMHADIEKLTASDSPVGHLLTFMRRIESGPERLTELAEGLSYLKSKLPMELRQGDDALDMESPESLRQILDDARQILLSRLLKKEAG